VSHPKSFHQPFKYAVLSLTVVWMLPVAVALIGTRLSPATVLFMGWFGPRGLVSIVLGVMFLERYTNLPGESTIRLAVIVTALLSIVLHGLSVVPGIDLYARSVAGLPTDASEHRGEEPRRSAVPGSAYSTYPADLPCRTFLPDMGGGTAHGQQPRANNGTIRGEFDSKSIGRKVTRRSNGLRTLTSSRYASIYFHRRQDPDRAVSASSA